MRLSDVPRRVYIIGGLVFCVAAFFAQSFVRSQDLPPEPFAFADVKGHRYYKVAIDFEYRNKRYHREWVDDCTLFESGPPGYTHVARSRWLGVAQRLDDGSGVYFQFQRDICDVGESADLIRGEPAPRDPWEPKPDYNPEGDAIDAFARSHPLRYVAPIVYWLNNADNPTQVEMCGLPECAINPTARVRFLGLRGAPTPPQKATDPRSDLPVLARVISGHMRFVGYACWRIPMAEIQDAQIKQDFLKYVATKFSAYRARGVMTEIGLNGQSTVNAWNNYFVIQLLPPPVSDENLSHLEFPEQQAKFFGSHQITCARNGASLQMGSMQPPTEPIQMRLLDVRRSSPTNLILPSGNQIETPANGDIPFVTENNSYLLSTAALGPDQTIYLGEAIILFAQFPALPD